MGLFYSESATHYRYYRLIGDPSVSYGRVADILRLDTDVQHPEGLAVTRELPFGMEMFYGLLRRWLAPRAPSHVFLMHAVPVFSGLSLLATFALTWRLTGSWRWSLLAAGLYGTITWSFARSARGTFLRNSTSPVRMSTP